MNQGAERAACAQRTWLGAPVKGGVSLTSGHAPLDWQVAWDREQDLRTTYRMPGPAVAYKLVLLEERQEEGEGEQEGEKEGWGRGRGRGRSHGVSG